MKIYIAADGDDIGSRIGRLSLANREIEMVRLSAAIKQANQVLVSYALANDGKVLTEGGDEINMTLPADRLKDLPKLREQWKDAAGATLTVGVGRNLAEAGKALMAGKLKGKDQIVLYSPEVEAEIEQMQAEFEQQGPKAERQKIGEGYFKAEDLAKAKKGLPVGTIRTWGGVKYIKHHDGWVYYSEGAHQGKLLGKFKEPPQEHHKAFVTEAYKTPLEAAATPTPPPSSPSPDPTSPSETPEAPSDAPVATPPDETPGWKPTPPSEPESPPAPAEPKDLGGFDDDSFEAPMAPEDYEEHAQDTHRDEAAKETEKAKEDYVNARASKFSNMGEDIVESARHKALQWKGLMDLESEGNAEQAIKRDQLLKLNPPKLADKINQNNYMGALALQYALERMPPGPVSGWLKYKKDAPDDAIVYYKKTMPTGEMYRTFKPMASRGQDPAEYTPVTVGEAKKEARKHYLDTYEALKAAAESILERGHGLSFLDTLDSFRVAASGIVKDRRSVDRYDDMANAMIPYVNRVVSSRGRSSHSVMADMGHFAQAAMKHYGIDPEQDGVKKLLGNEQVQQDVQKILGEGKDYKKLYGVESEHKGEGHTSMAEYYLGSAERKGATVEFPTARDQEGFLLGKAKIRGLQWGNSVSDDEREHHLKLSAESFKDLVDVLGLPDEMVSFNGRLALAIGARGKGRALAHYEPDLMVINLTRAKGAGSLAHEWGHFWDNIAAKVQGKGAYLSSRASYSARADVPMLGQTTEIEMQALFGSKEYRGYRERLIKAIYELGRQGAKPYGGVKYWTDPKEMFARMFETHVDFKLKAAGRLNTYLTGVGPGQSLWPQPEEQAAFAPYFDKIFDAFKNSEDMKKAIQWLEDNPMRKEETQEPTSEDLEYQIPGQESEDAGPPEDLRARIQHAIEMAHQMHQGAPEGEEGLPESTPMDSEVPSEPMGNDQMPPEAAAPAEGDLPEGADMPTPGPDAGADQQAMPPEAADQQAAPPDAAAEQAPPEVNGPPADQDPKARLRNMIGEVLTEVQAAAPQLEAMKDKNPEVYKAVLDAINAMIQMASGLMDQEQPEAPEAAPEMPPEQEEAPQEPEEGATELPPQ